MTNEVFKDYIERKKEEFIETVVNKVPLMEHEAYPVIEFLSDMAQEIFGCLPKEKDPLNPDTVLWRERAEGHNSCRSTFLENIKKLK